MMVSFFHKLHSDFYNYLYKLKSAFSLDRLISQLFPLMLHA